MNGRIINMDIPSHQAIRELLPWYAAAQLTPQETARVQEHLQHCAHCRQELEWERMVRAQIAAAPSAPPDGLDPERALARLLPALEAQPAAAAPATDATPTAAPSWWRKLADAPRPWLRWTVAAQWGLIAGLLVLLARPGAPPARYHALGADAGKHGNIVLVFKPDVPESELRRILQARGARVVDGPTVADAYLVAVPAATRAHALQALRAEAAVKLAEPLDEGAPP